MEERGRNHIGRVGNQRPRRPLGVGVIGEVPKLSNRSCKRHVVWDMRTAFARHLAIRQVGFLVVLDRREADAPHRSARREYVVRLCDERD